MVCAGHYQSHVQSTTTALHLSICVGLTVAIWYVPDNIPPAGGPLHYQRKSYNCASILQHNLLKEHFGTATIMCYNYTTTIMHPMPH